MPADRTSSLAPAPAPAPLRLVALAALIGAAVSTIGAQPAFRSTVDLVTVPVTVTGRDPTRRLGELQAADFRLYEDGVLQTVSVVSHQPRPLSICILLDSSPSMASGRQRLASQAIDTLLSGLEADDEVTMLFFASRMRLAFPWTRAKALTPISWIEWRLALGTALIDAIKEGFRLTSEASHASPVILVVSDGGENSSGTSLGGLVATRRQSETLIYGIHTDLAPFRNAPLVNRAFTDFLPDLVGDSGGTVFRARDPQSATAAAQALLEELRAQYTVGYSPKLALDGKYRQLKIETTNAALTVRHRGGYLAQK